MHASSLYTLAPGCTGGDVYAHHIPALSSGQGISTQRHTHTASGGGFALPVTGGDVHSHYNPALSSGQGISTQRLYKGCTVHGWLANACQIISASLPRDTIHGWLANACQISSAGRSP